MTAAKRKLINPALRAAMLWPHTWAGVTLGGLLMLIFFMGSLAVFASEIDRWMMPDTRIGAVEAPDAAVSLDRTVVPLVERLAAGRAVRDWYVQLPDERRPVMALRVRTESGNAGGMATAGGTLLPPVGTLGASSFFYPLHYSLHLRAGFVGYWIVSFASVAMLAGLISGVIIHARIFKDFFTFRSWGQLRRSLLDLHNLTGVLVLPFHLMITFTGIVIILPIVLPAGVQALYGGNVQRFYDDALGNYSRPRAGIPAAAAPLDPMLAEARRLWGGGEPAVVFVYNAGDAASVVRINRDTGDRISLDVQPVFFDGVTGALLKYQPRGPMVAAHRVMSGLHFAAFEHWPLRWLYFLFGLAGCVLIGTGMLHWMEKRRVVHGLPGVGWRSVAALTCGTTTGLLIATLAMMTANRLLPSGVPSRELVEVGVFFLTWIASAVHAAVRTRLDPPWSGQCAAVALLAAACVVLNWITTGEHPVRAASAGDWAVVGVDAVLALTAAGAWRVSRRLARRARPEPSTLSRLTDHA
ncbi:PepSY-associated TM helix domain-containing protein [Azospirillum sp. Sh1]|uniref:PepSY-associated TM helix domain-containing protein n=1 Tax=Azospirillum sp. Sh1 TaxID=2607285 RepID=UPI0011EBB81C|nr:PepSY-associated TM helix domain-containing protein [Azospirillum sp. Sh1]KAA0578657.1 PepSY domain-containing protein [Azospirillum sp. Sh1]